MTLLLFLSIHNHFYMNQLYNITFILMLTNIHNVTLANYEKKKLYV